MNDDELAAYPLIGGFRCNMRRVSQMISGNIVEFFVSIDTDDCDAVLALGKRDYKDAQFYISVHMIKDKVGRDMRIGAAPVSLVRPEPAPEGKPYGALATLLYRRGFFVVPQVRAAIGKPAAGDSQGCYADTLAQALGYESMGFVPPDELLDWADRNQVVWCLPQEYRDFAPLDGDHVEQE